MVEVAAADGVVLASNFSGECFNRFGSRQGVERHVQLLSKEGAAIVGRWRSFVQTTSSVTKEPAIDRGDGAYSKSPPLLSTGLFLIVLELIRTTDLPLTSLLSTGLVFL